jgi:hypothetical protein
MVIGVPTASYVVAWWKFVRKEIIADREGCSSTSPSTLPLLKLKKSFTRAMAML